VDDGALLVVDYDPEWPHEFERIRARAFEAVGGLAVAVEHVGSTAVPGMSAKPIVDVDVVVARETDVAAAVERLVAIGYRREGRDVDVAGLCALGWPDGEQRHHLYVVVDGSRVQRERIRFRELLRASPAAAAEYARAKRELAAQHADDWGAYAVAKDAVVERLLAHP
jgi:GrpB-like predicted nucleotidyltransferase (UPF0157 family)